MGSPERKSPLGSNTSWRTSNVSSSFHNAVPERVSTENCITREESSFAVAVRVLWVCAGVVIVAGLVVFVVAPLFLAPLVWVVLEVASLALLVPLGPAPLVPPSLITR